MAAARYRHTVAVAESCTAGALQWCIGRYPGVSQWFLGGVTCYTLELKAKLLQIDTDHAAEVNCISSRVAREMASGVQRLYGASIGVATTGYASPPPSGWPPGGEHGYCYYAISVDGQIAAEGLLLNRPDLDRPAFQQAVAGSVLARLLGLLLSDSSHPAPSPDDDVNAHLLGVLQDVCRSSTCCLDD